MAAAGGDLTWDRAVSRAAEGNPEIRAAVDAVRQARFQRYGTWSQFSPRLSTSAGMSRGGAYGGLFSDDETFGEGDGGGSLGLSARETVFSGLSRLAALDRSAAAVLSAETSLVETRSRVGYELSSAFAQLLYAQEAARLAGEILARRDDDVRLVELRFDAGREHDGSLRQTKAQALQARIDTERSEQDTMIASRRLARVMGEDAPDRLSVAGVLGVPPPGERPDFASLTSNTPDLARARIRVAQAKAAVLTAWGAFMPSVGASASLSRRVEDGSLESGSWSTGLDFSYPLFSGGSRWFDLESARSDLRQAEAALENTMRQAAIALEEAFNAHRNTVEQARVQEEFLAAAKIRAEIARVQYTQGLLSFENWAQIENELITYEKQVLSGRRDAFVAHAAWDRALGKGPLP
jgi:outer membrane protein TolC